MPRLDSTAALASGNQCNASNKLIARGPPLKGIIISLCYLNRSLWKVHDIMLLVIPKISWYSQQSSLY